MHLCCKVISVNYDISKATGRHSTWYLVHTIGVVTEMAVCIKMFFNTLMYFENRVTSKFYRNILRQVNFNCQTQKR